jgi:hypothetical protein
MAAADSTTFEISVATDRGEKASSDLTSSM